MMMARMVLPSTIMVGAMKIMIVIVTSLKTMVVTGDC